MLLALRRRLKMLHNSALIKLEREIQNQLAEDAGKALGHFLRGLFIDQKIYEQLNKINDSYEKMEAKSKPVETWLDFMCSVYRNNDGAEFDFSKCAFKDNFDKTIDNFNKDLYQLSLVESKENAKILNDKFHNMKNYKELYGAYDSLPEDLKKKVEVLMQRDVYSDKYSHQVKYLNGIYKGAKLKEVKELMAPYKHDKDGNLVENKVQLDDFGRYIKNCTPYINNITDKKIYNVMGDEFNKEENIVKFKDKEFGRHKYMDYLYKKTVDSSMKLQEEISADRKLLSESKAGLSGFGIKELNTKVSKYAFEKEREVEYRQAAASTITGACKDPKVAKIIKNKTYTVGGVTLAVKEVIGDKKTSADLDKQVETLKALAPAKEKEFEKTTEKALKEKKEATDKYADEMSNKIAEYKKTVPVLNNEGKAIEDKNGKIKTTSGLDKEVGEYKKQILDQLGVKVDKKALVKEANALFAAELTAAKTLYDTKKVEAEKSTDPKEKTKNLETAEKEYNSKVAEIKEKAKEYVEQKYSTEVKEKYSEEVVAAGIMVNKYKAKVTGILDNAVDKIKSLKKDLTLENAAYMNYSDPQFIENLEKKFSTTWTVNDYNKILDNIKELPKVFEPEKRTKALNNIVKNNEFIQNRFNKQLEAQKGLQGIKDRAKENERVRERKSEEL